MTATVTPPLAAAPAAPRKAVKREAPIDEKTAIAQYNRLKKLVSVQGVLIGILGFAVFGAIALTRPVELYYAITPEKNVVEMVGLNAPNMTTRAVLAWTTNSITEIMTMGFGDMGVRLPKQKWRFTDEGWDAYKTAFIKQKVGETFRQSQLVLTTVPSNTPVIIGQGVNPDNVYQWNVQMPVVMTYATNNNVMLKHRSIVTLAIIRVPAEEHTAGIAIQSWEMY